jgi:hypothetical protein
MNEIDDTEDYLFGFEVPLFLEGCCEDPFEFYRNIPGYYSLEELDVLAWVEFPMVRNSIRVEFEYSPPWISEELLEYSLKGISSIKL